MKRSMVMNSSIHIIIETRKKDKIKNEAKEEGISMAMFCRKKILESSQLNRIENMLQKLVRRKNL